MVAVACNYTNVTLSCGWFTHCCPDRVGCCLSVWTVVWTAVTLLAGLAFLVLLVFWACRASAFRSVQAAARRRRQAGRRGRTAGACGGTTAASARGRRARSNLQSGEPQGPLEDKRSPSPPPPPPPSLPPAPRAAPPFARAPSPAPAPPPRLATSPPPLQQPRTRGSRSHGGGGRRERSVGPGPGGGLGPGSGGGSGSSSSAGGGVRRARPRRSFSEHEAGCKLRADGSGIKECNCGVGMIRVWSDAEGLGGGPFISVQGINPSH